MGLLGDLLEDAGYKPDQNHSRENRNRYNKNSTKKGSTHQNRNTPKIDVNLDNNPYNFIPLNEKVVFPDKWSKKVSFDYPLEGSITGEIDLTLTAQSPIMIADNKEKDSTKLREFCKTANGEHLIPATTIKGSIRSIFEILTFSKMTQINRLKFSHRDFNLDDYLEEMKKTKTGWLEKRGNDLVINECSYGRASYKVLKKLYKNLDLYKRKNAFERYQSVNFKGGEKLEVFVDKSQYKTLKNSGDKIYQKLYYEDKKKETNATVVFTGSAVGGESIKNHAFLFFDIKANREFTIGKDVYENFLQAYYDNEPDESATWKYLKARLKKGLRVPIFFQEENNKVIHFGLSKLYKLPFKNSVANLIDKYADHKSEKLDMAQTLFGYVNNQDALRGRVQFSHLFSQEAKYDKPYSLILGGPKGSYYPFYLKNGSKIATYNDDNANISGYKRYPIHNSFTPENVGTKPTLKNKNVTTTFKPLQKGTIFKGSLKFFNLKEEELGALISALTFHNNKEFYHSIGLAKPFGFGQTSIEINLKNRDQTPLDKEKYLKIFEQFMNDELKRDWIKTKQIRELFALANRDHKINFSYPQLQKEIKGKKRNEFEQFKKQGKSLKEFSKISNFNKQIQSAL